MTITQHSRSRGSVRALAGSHPHVLALALIVLLGAGLRLYAFSWDDGLYLHPDERFIAIVSSERIDMPAADNLGALFDPEHSPINPRRDDETGRPLSFAYGTLPIYVQSTVSWVVNLVAERDYQSYQHLWIVGRALTVLLDCLTIVTVYLLGRRVFSSTAGLVGALLYATAVLPIQLSHFFTVDVWLTCFVTVALYLAIRFMDHATLGRALAMAVPVGAAFATKASVPSLLAPLALVAIVAVWRAAQLGEGWALPISRMILAGALALAVFTLFEPYAIIHRAPFIADIRLQADIVRGKFDVPYTRQFIGLTPGLYEIENMVRYTLGPAFFLSAVAGFALMLRRSALLRDPRLLVLLLWIVAYIPTLLITEARFLRYALPMVPTMAVLAGCALALLVQHRPGIFGRAVMATALIVTAVWAFGFTSIYSHEHARIAASKWMHANIAPGSSVTAEAWDDALPLPYPDAPPVQVVQVSFDVYGDTAPEQTVERIATTLQQADYVILSSDRIRMSIDQLPWRYAVQNEYYRRLLAGELGFELVYEHRVKPGLFGLTIDDTNADESFTVYDHPHVRIFRKVEQLSTEQIRERLRWSIAQPWIPARDPGQQWLLLEQPVDTIGTDDGAWNPLAGEVTLLDVVFWLLVIECLGLAALPVAALVLGRAADRGAASARLLGLLLVAWVNWLAGSLGWWRVGATSLWVITLLLAAGAWGWWRYARQRPALPTRRAYTAIAALWLAVFGAFLFLRALYPDVWQTYFGGEKPFEIAYLRAIAQSETFPPYDPWYADGIINYYYYGWHLCATMIRMAGLEVGLGFQLATATFTGLFAIQLAGFAAVIARRFVRRAHLLLACAVTLLTVLFVGNLDALRQVIEMRGFDSNGFDFWRSTRVIDYTITEFPYFSVVWADLHPHVLNLPILALLLTLLAGGLANRSWGGLRHAVPLALACALALGSAFVTNAWDAPAFAGLTIVAFAWAGWRRSWLDALTGAGLGGLTIALGWLLFAPFHAHFYSVVSGVQRASDGSPVPGFLTHWGGVALLLLLGMLLPVLAGWRQEAIRRDGLVLLVLTLAGGTLIQLLALIDGRSIGGEVIVALLLAGVVLGIGGAAGRVGGRHPAIVIVTCAACVAIGLAVTWRPAGALALAFGVAALLQVRGGRRDPFSVLPWLLTAAATFIIAGTEIIYVSDDLRNSPWERMNSVFKFSFQAWLLLGIAAAMVIVGTVARAGWPAPHPRAHRAPTMPPAHASDTTPDPMREEFEANEPPARRVHGIHTLARGHVVVMASLVALLLLYPLLGTPVRLSWDMDGSPGGLMLDGYAWMRDSTITNHSGDVITFAGDLAAIEWLHDNADTTDVLLEASIGPYRGNGARISSATGMPTVLGWDRHQRQQRYLPGIDQRMRDIRYLYNLTDPAEKLDLLRAYRVTWIVVGDVERVWNTEDDPLPYASAAGLAAFDQLVGAGLSIAFQQDGTTIYRVDPFPRLAADPNADHSP